MLRLLLCTATIFISYSAFADKCDIVFYDEVHVSASNPPKTLVDIVNSKEVKIVARAAAGALGLPPQAGDQAIVATSMLGPRTTVNGSDVSVSGQIPDGFVYCAGEVAINSLASGAFAAWRNEKTFSLTYGLKIPGNFAGGSWVDARFRAVGVRHRYLEHMRKQGICVTDNQNAKLNYCNSSYCPPVFDGNLARVAEEVEFIIEQDADLKDCRSWFPKE